mmetsp:Transcript_34862/g.68836  ORF Transcript_34862/g.68836 Transcript_34862/m.68836 type:complete len:230 (-) Transcript_34862:492-1181(-)
MLQEDTTCKACHSKARVRSKCLRVLQACRLHMHRPAAAVTQMRLNRHLRQIALPTQQNHGLTSRMSDTVASTGKLKNSGNSDMDNQLHAWATLLHNETRGSRCPNKCSQQVLATQHHLRLQAEAKLAETRAAKVEVGIPKKDRRGHRHKRQRPCKSGWRFGPWTPHHLRQSARWARVKVKVRHRLRSRRWRPKQLRQCHICLTPRSPFCLLRQQRAAVVAKRSRGKTTN